MRTWRGGPAGLGGEASLEDADLSGAALSRADLDDANLDAGLDDTELDDSQLADADVNGAGSGQAALDRAALDQATVNEAGVTEETQRTGAGRGFDAGRSHAVPYIDTGSEGGVMDVGGGEPGAGRVSAMGATNGPEADGTGVGDTSTEEAKYLTACVTDVREWLGQELVAYLAGAESPAELARWSRASKPRTSDGSASPSDPPRSLSAQVSAAGRRLRTVNEVVEFFTAAGQGTRAQAWLREVSPKTAGRSPAHLIRYARTEQLLDQVRSAAEWYLRTARSSPATTY